MVTGWVKSLQCKSKALEDVYRPNPILLVPSYSCRKSAQSLKDVIEAKKPRKPKPKPKTITANRKPEPVANHPTLSRPSFSGADPARNPDQCLPSLTELPEGHASWNVVDIIFHTSWGPKAFSGLVEMIFKVHNGSWTVTRFEEYREAVKARSKGNKGGALEENARCVADGNEMMRFYCLGPAAATWTCGGSALGLLGRKSGGSSICTFSGSGAAHERSVGGRGRRAMLVCRVIAGRVGKRWDFGFDSVDPDGRVKFDSVSGNGDELHVFDSRALLPCFLVIYRL